MENFARVNLGRTGSYRGAKKVAIIPKGKNYASSKVENSSYKLVIKEKLFLS